MAKYKHFQKGKKPKLALSAHATLRIHQFGNQQRIEVGFRIPLEMEKRLIKELWKKESLRSLVSGNRK